MGLLKKEELLKRVNRAEELLIEHTVSGHITAALMADFGCSERSSWRYIEKARARWSEEAENLEPAERERAREKMRRTLNYVKSRGFKTNEFRIVLGATTQLRALDGLDMPKELRLTGAIGVVDTGMVFQERSTEDLLAFLRTGRLPPKAVDTADE